MPRPSLTAAALAMAVAACGPAYAQAPACLPSLEMLATVLERDYKETPVVTGIAGTEGSLLTIFSTPDGRTWTIAITRPEDGRTCMVVSGHSLSVDTTALPRS